VGALYASIRTSRPSCGTCERRTGARVAVGELGLGLLYGAGDLD
jgi:hypothetical protein